MFRLWHERPHIDDKRWPVRRKGKGQSIWCLKENLAIDGDGNVVNCEDYGLEWISHLTEGDGRYIAKQEMACVGEGPLTTRYFDAVCHFLGNSLEDLCAYVHCTVLYLAITTTPMWNLLKVELKAIILEFVKAIGGWNMTSMNQFEPHLKRKKIKLTIN